MMDLEKTWIKHAPKQLVAYVASSGMQTDLGFSTETRDEQETHENDYVVRTTPRRSVIVQRRSGGCEWRISPSAVSFLSPNLDGKSRHSRPIATEFEKAWLQDQATLW